MIPFLFWNSIDLLNRELLGSNPLYCLLLNPLGQHPNGKAFKICCSKTKIERNKWDWSNIFQDRMQPAQKRRQQSCPEYCCCHWVQGLAFSAVITLTAWLLGLLSVYPIKLCSSDIWNCYNWEMIFWGFQWETAKCLHLGARHTLDLLELAVTPTLSASYRKETERYCRIMQRKSIHFSQPHEHLFSNFPLPASSLTAARESKLMI